MNLLARRLLASAALALVLAGVGAAAPAQASPYDESCRWLHGDDYCRRLPAPIPTDATVGAKPPPKTCTAHTRQDPDTNGPCGWVDERGERWT